METKKMSFPQYFSQEISKIRIIPKKKSVFMSIISFFLLITNKLKITNIEDFENDYITTIGNRIYGTPDWSMEMDIEGTLLHELTHVVESEVYNFYHLLYLISSRKRAFFESVCMQAEMLYSPALRRIESIEKRAKYLQSYGCKYNVALDELQKRLREIQENRVEKPARVVFDAYRKWKIYLRG